MSMKAVLFWVSLAIVFLTTFTVHGQQDATGAFCLTWQSEWRAQASTASVAQAQGFLARVPEGCAGTRYAVQQHIEQLTCSQARAEWPELRDSRDVAMLRQYARNLPATCQGQRQLVEARIEELERASACDAAESLWIELRDSMDETRLQAFVQVTSSCAVSRPAQDRLAAVRRVGRQVRQIDLDYQAEIDRITGDLRSDILSERSLPPELADWISNRVNLRVCTYRAGARGLPTPQQVLGGSTVLEQSFGFSGTLGMSLRGYRREDVDEARADIREEIVDACNDVWEEGVSAAREKTRLLQ